MRGLELLPNVEFFGFAAGQSVVGEQVCRVETFGLLAQMGQKTKKVRAFVGI